MMRRLDLCALLLTVAACSSFSGQDNELASLAERPAVKTDEPDAADASKTPADDASVDAAETPDASADTSVEPGDPSLRRPPKAGCEVVASDAALTQGFDGWWVSRYSPPGTTASYQQARCAQTDLLSLALSYPAPQTAPAPAIVLAREVNAAGQVLEWSWIVEGLAKPAEDEETFAGGLVISRGDERGLSLSMRHRSASSELVVRHGSFELAQGLGVEELAERSLGTPLPPYRVRWRLEQAAGSRQLTSTIQVTDGTSDRTEIIVEQAFSDTLELSFGVNRHAPGPLSRLTVSELSLP